MLLAIDAGNTNIKFALFEADSTSKFPKVLVKIRGVGTQPEFSAVGEHVPQFRQMALRRLLPIRNQMPFLLPHQLMAKRLQPG